MVHLVELDISIPATFEQELDCETETDVLAFFLSFGEARFDNGAYEYPVNQAAWKAWVEQPQVAERLHDAYRKLAVGNDELSLLLDVQTRRLYCGGCIEIERLVGVWYSNKLDGVEQAPLRCA